MKEFLQIKDCFLSRRRNLMNIMMMRKDIMIIAIKYRLMD
jgi:hypothetical protein